MRIHNCIATFFLLIPALSYADSLSDRIKIGQSQDDVSITMGGSPYDSDCSSTFGVKMCKLSWKKANFDKSNFSAIFYEVSLVADKVVSVNVQSKSGVYK